MTGFLRACVLGLAGATCIVGTASAGGFARGTADTDILYEDGNFSMRSGVSIVTPQRGYETINGVAATDSDFVDQYVIPNSAIKLNITDDLRCAGTHTHSFGGGVTYGPQAIAAGLADGTGTSSESFVTNEFGLTCAYKIDNVGSFGVGTGRLFVIGGVFAEDFTYQQTVRLASAAQLAAGGSPLAPFGGAAPAAHSGTLSFDGGYEVGYRLGLGYEIPEIAARVQLLYRSQINHNPGGQFRFFNTLTNETLLGGGAILPTRGVGTLPQSLELKFQSGVAPGTLVFGSVKWTDWSVLDTLDYSIFSPAGTVNTNLEYFWKDGWTVTAGVGRQITENVAASASLTWDQGVSTTEDVLSDTWTLGAGVSVTGERAQLQLGGALSYLTAGSVEREAVLGRGGPGDTFAYTVGNDWAFALGGRLSVNW